MSNNTEQTQMYVQRFNNGENSTSERLVISDLDMQLDKEMQAAWMKLKVTASRIMSANNPYYLVIKRAVDASLDGDDPESSYVIKTKMGFTPLNQDRKEWKSTPFGGVLPITKELKDLFIQSMEDLILALNGFEEKPIGGKWNAANYKSRLNKANRFLPPIPIVSEPMRVATFTSLFSTDVPDGDSAIKDKFLEPLREKCLIVKNSNSSMAYFGSITVWYAPLINLISYKAGEWFEYVRVVTVDAYREGYLIPSNEWGFLKPLTVTEVPDNKPLEFDEPAMAKLVAGLL